MEVGLSKRKVVKDSESYLFSKMFVFWIIFPLWPHGGNAAPGRTFIVQAERNNEAKANWLILIIEKKDSVETSFYIALQECLCGHLVLKGRFEILLFQPSRIHTGKEEDSWKWLHVPKSLQDETATLKQRSQKYKKTKEEIDYSKKIEGSLKKIT